MDKRLYSELVIVLTTEVNDTVASCLAKELVKRNLVACVNLREIKSYFSWEGKIEEVKEVQLLMKTTKDQMQNLFDVINQLHTYDIPELLYWNASASDSYREWVETSVSIFT